MNIKLYIVGRNSDDKGTQLEELTSTILRSQGYTNISTNAVYGGGNEIDVIAVHKNPLGTSEMNYPVICECKAHNKPINLNDWLKFIGKVSLERLKKPHTTGLMIALSGANGNVMGSYSDVIKHEFIHLIANDDLVTLLKEEYSLAQPSHIETYISKYTNRVIAEIGLIYYSKSIYWIVNFIENGFTILKHNVESLNDDEIKSLLPLLESNTTFATYIDIKAEYTAIMRRSSIDKKALCVLMDTPNSLSLEGLISGIKNINAEHQEDVTQNELIAILTENQFIQKKRNKYSLYAVENIDAIELYRHIFTNVTPIRILSRKLYVNMINNQLLDRICEIQHCIKIPEERKAECLFLLRHSPTALAYAINEDKDLTRFRSSDGNTIAENVDKGHTEWFMHKIINSFIQDYYNQMLHELYLKEYEITSVCINIGLEIIKENQEKIIIKDKTDLLLGRLDGEFNNQIVLLSRLPEK